MYGKISIGIINKYIPQMNTSPGYYAGRGATITDLKPEYLIIFHDKIKKEVSKDAALNFIKMVKNIKCASATNFLISLYRLENNSWKYDNNNDENSDYIENKGQAIGLVVEKLSNTNKTDCTLHIVREFLSKFNELHISDNKKNIFYKFFNYR